MIRRYYAHSLDWDTDLMWFAVIMAGWGFKVVDRTDNSEIV